MKLPELPDEISKDGFFDLVPNGEHFSKVNRCYDQRHNPPMFMDIPYGKGYRHTCPSCKHVSIVTNWQQTTSVFNQSGRLYIDPARYKTLDCVGSDAKVGNVNLWQEVSINDTKI